MVPRWPTPYWYAHASSARGPTGKRRRTTSRLSRSWTSLRFLGSSGRGDRVLNLRPSQDKCLRTPHRLAAEGWMSADIAIYREFNPGEVRWDAETNEIV